MVIESNVAGLPASLEHVSLEITFRIKIQSWPASAASQSPIAGGARGVATTHRVTSPKPPPQRPHHQAESAASAPSESWLAADAATSHPQNAQSAKKPQKRHLAVPANATWRYHQFAATRPQTRSKRPAPNESRQPALHRRAGWLPTQPRASPQKRPISQETPETPLGSSCECHLALPPVCRHPPPNPVETARAKQESAASAPSESWLAADAATS